MLAHTRVQQMSAIRTTGGMERLAQVSRPHGSGAQSVSRIASCESDQTERPALGRLTTSPKTTLRDERHVLTDGWNYEKVVVGCNLRAEVRMKSSHSVWAKYREAGKVIDLDGLFSDYWSSNNREFIVLSQSLQPTSPHRSD